jgi:hypothetical protein
MGRPAGHKSTLHPLLSEITSAADRVDVLERRLATARKERHQAIALALAAGLRQSDCARALGVSRAQISRLVAEHRLAPGAQDPPPPELGTDCHRCGQPGWLVRGGTELLCTSCATTRALNPTKEEA